MKHFFIIFLSAILTSPTIFGQSENIEKCFIGVWHSVKWPIPHSAEIQISEDNSFHYKVGACTFHSFSEGEWRVEDSLLILASHTPDSCMVANTFGNECIPVDSIPESIATIEGCEPEFEGMEFTIFDNEQFYIYNDTLRHISRKRICPNVHDDYVR